MPGLDSLLAEVRQCTRCSADLPAGPRPVLQVHPCARLLIAAQAPGRKVHASGIAFDDASGDRLRAWLGLWLNRNPWFAAKLLPALQARVAQLLRGSEQAEIGHRCG